MTDVNLAVCTATRRVLKGLHGHDPCPSLLVSFHYLDSIPFDALTMRHWVMDSGAFSALNSGAAIDLQKYIDTCAARTASDPRLKRVFALDVIGDWKASLKNTEEMWRQGIEAVPCFHIGEPWDVLTCMVRDYPRVALGGTVGRSYKERRAWFAHVFSRAWPARFHAFGVTTMRLLDEFPFESADSTGWNVGPAWGRWKSLPGLRPRTHSGMGFKGEVAWYLEHERRLKFKWRHQMAQLEAL